MLPVTLESCTKMMSPGPSTSPRPPAPLSEVKELNGAVDVPSPPGAAEPFTYQIIGPKVRLTVPPLSCSETVTVAEPFAFGAGVKVSTPAGEIDGCALNRALLLLATMKWTVCPASFGPAEMAVAHAAEYAPLSSSTATLPPAVKLGASLTPVTWMVKVTFAEVSAPPLAVPPLSCRFTVTVESPNAFGAG